MSIMPSHNCSHLAFFLLSLQLLQVQGDASANYGVGYAYCNGEGVERDMKKGKHYYELGAMGGDVTSMHNLGIFEANAGNPDRSVKHWMIAAGAGRDDSLKEIRQCFMDGEARAHKEATDEMKSDQREKAAASRAQPNH